jgi:hypothetical protein
MAKETCDGCGRRVAIGGGTDTLWTFSEGPGGMALELVDGADVFLCFDCIERLPDDRDVVSEDVAALPDAGDEDVE